MNKLTLFGLLALVISSVYAQVNFEYCSDYNPLLEVDYKEDTGDDINGDLCSIFKTDGDRTHCCYVENLVIDNDQSYNHHCIQITDDQYENIKNFKKYVRGEYNSEDFEIDCSSKFVSISLFAVLALLI